MGIFLHHCKHLHVLVCLCIILDILLFHLLGHDFSTNWHLFDYPHNLGSSRASLVLASVIVSWRHHGKYILTLAAYNFISPRVRFCSGLIDSSPSFWHHCIPPLVLSDITLGAFCITAFILFFLVSGHFHVVKFFMSLSDRCWFHSRCSGKKKKKGSWTW